MISVQLVDVSKTFTAGPGGRTITAVDKVNLVLAPGERLGIIGPNGAGKSTLLQMIAGLTPPTSGAVTVTGHVTAVMTLGIGLRDQVTGRENIYLDGELHGRSRAEINRFIDSIVEFTELGGFIDQPVRTYSTGMKARLAFAMITHLEPEVLVIDEALSVGDAAFARKATAKIRELCGRGRIVIIVSHSLSAIREMCTRCVWMQQGRIVADGDPADVTARYLDAVRQDDQRDAIVRFSKTAGQRVLISGWRVSAKLDQGNGGEARVLESGRPLFMRMEVTVVPELSWDVVVSIVRLDGSRLFQERFAPRDFTVHGNDAQLCVAMEPLVLGAGVYRLDVAIQTNRGRAAETAVPFEVFEPLPLTGGRPLLSYPIDVQVIDISSR